MKKPSRAGGKPAKERPRKAVKRKGRSAPRAAPRRSSSPIGQKAVARLAGELNEAREQQRATAEVLSAISRSNFELQPILQSVVDTASQLCRADSSVIFRLEGGVYRFAAGYSLSPAYLEHERRTPIYPGPGTVIGRAAMSRQVVRIEDAWTDPLYEQKAAVKMARGGRSMIGVPLMREGEPIGVIGLARSRVDPFTEREIDLVTTFADQAVIAIENVRLFEAEQQRSRELSESLEQQTATSEVLQVISSSSGELQPVFQAMLENATRICEAKFGVLYRYDDAGFEPAALSNAPPAYANFVWSRGQFFPQTGNGLDRLLRTKTVIHSVDEAAEPVPTNSARLAAARSQVLVPMLKEGKLAGAIAIYRQEVRPFSDKQIELVKNFAAQAVIAIENTRLLSELRESLQEQTATSEVLQVISSSPGDLQPVFDTMLEKAVRICDAKSGGVYRWDSEGMRLVAMHKIPAAYAEAGRFSPFRPGPKHPLGRMIATKTAVQIADAATDQGYIERRPEMVAVVELGGVRTFLVVPMLKENELIGAFFVARQEVRPFTEKQIALVTNFAAQAVIAIENTRLLNELRQRTADLSQRTADLTESLQQQTATADVLKVISRSTFDLQTVLNTLVESATRLCEAESAHIFRRSDTFYELASCRGYSREYEELMRGYRIAPGRATLVGRIALEGRVVHIPDVLADPEYDLPEQQRLGGWRTMLGVPLSREGVPIGALTLTRSIVRPFTDKQVELVTTFADQAVIAIENTRLLNELRESLQQQTATADVLKVISRSTFDLQTVLQTLVESAARLCDADKATITRQRGEVFYRAEAYGFSAEFMDYVRSIPIKPERGSLNGRVLLEGSVVHIPDVLDDPEYSFIEGQKAGGYRTLLGVPMLREGVPIGVLSLTRSEVRPFTDKQIELVSTFADQAAIAIENVRLFESVEARTRELAKSLEDVRTAQDRLIQTEKLASLGQLTAGIAHEIKNPLNFVNNFSAVSVELIDELREALVGVQLDSKLRTEITEIADMLQGNLDKVVQHGKRADSIVKNMLLHSRQGSGEHRPVDINALVEESLNLAYHGARAEKQGFNITLERSFDPAAGEVDLFPQEITRALLNLISNGFYAATKRKAEANGGDYEPTLAAATKNLGDRVEIRIRDNGTGIPPEVKVKLFNPFFTTKPAGEGTGLGLSISHDIIVKQHGGSIEVDTQPGEFTEFRIVLPRTGAALIKSGERA